MNFFKPRFKKIDAIEYKGFEIPIYSNGGVKYVGHPHVVGVEVSDDKIYNVEDLHKIKGAIYMVSKFGEEVDLDDFLPDSIGKVKVKKPFRFVSESKIKEIVNRNLKETPHN